MPLHSTIGTKDMQSLSIPDNCFPAQLLSPLHQDMNFPWHILPRMVMIVTGRSFRICLSISRRRVDPSSSEIWLGLPTFFDQGLLMDGLVK
jgi:hypothetical protein